jgi:hypothetical protein
MINTRAFLMVVAASLVLASAAYADSAYETLRSAGRFGIGGFGIAGTITPEEIAFRKIRRSSAAREQFRKILREGTAEGRMYALLGLKQLNTPEYEGLAKPYRHSKVSVQRYAGCVGFTEPTFKVVQWIERYADTLKEISDL